MRLFKSLGLLVLVVVCPGRGARPAGANVRAGADRQERSGRAGARAGGDLHQRRPRTTQTGEDLPGYLAQLKVVEVKKGDVKPGEVVLVTWRAIPKDVNGPWTVYYYPGEEMVTHLTKRSGGATYASTWWNAKGDDTTIARHP